MHKFCAEMKIFNDAVNIFRTKLNGIMFAIFLITKNLILSMWILRKGNENESEQKEYDSCG